MRIQPVVSVIIIFLDEEKYLQEAIESVFAQSFPAWELLLVDDGSTDGSTDIARDWAERYPNRVRYLEHDGHANCGMSASRNLGMGKAAGKYTSFLDGDDVWLPTKVKEQVAILEEHPEAAMVYAPLKMWYSWTGEPDDIDGDFLYGVSSDGAYPFRDELIEPPALLSTFLRHEEYLPGGFMAKRETMLRLAPYENEFRGPYSDTVALVKLCLHEKVYASTKVWYLYRKHEESNTYISWIEDTGFAEQRLYLDWVEEYFYEIGLEDPELWRILNRMLLPHRHPIRYVFRRQLLRFTRRLSPRFFDLLRLLRKSSLMAARF
jgi:glycosyltransferase involved in cell wall biosynthesis